MKTKILLFSILLTVVAIVFNLNPIALGMSAGAPAGCSGAPSDMTTCKQSGCHSGNPISIVTGWITSNIPMGGYTPGQTYTITATATYSGLNKFGFEISPQDSLGNVLGTLVNTSTETHILTGNKYITHTITGNSNANFKTWTFNWIAPTSGSGSLKFYGTFACCDGDGTNLGDFVYVSNLATTEAPTNGTDAGIFPINYPNVFVCDSNFIPIVTLRNFGTTTLTTCDIDYFVDANSPSPYAWTGSLTPGNSIQVILPALTISTQATHTFTATTKNPNGIADAFTVNDQKSVIIQSVYTSRAMPFTEGFELSTFPPSGWVIKNPDNGVTWTRDGFFPLTGIGCMLMNNYGYPSRHQIDEIITPEINLTTSPTPSLSFQHAYQMYGDSGATVFDSDTLSIFISTDCGTTWTSLYRKYDTLLTTVIPAANNIQFWPDSTEWRLETINLVPYATCDNAIFKFQNITDYGNQLYIDDINIDGPLGLRNENTNNSTLDLFPIPANEFLTINLELEQTSSIEIKIYDLTGKLLSTKKINNVVAGLFTHSIDIKEYASGIYFLSIKTDKTVSTRKFIVQH